MLGKSASELFLVILCNVSSYPCRHSFQKDAQPALRLAALLLQ